MYADLFWDRNEAEHQKFLDNLAPIVLFTYNRLDQTRQTIEALQQNVYAKDSRLFIFSDAPNNEQAVDSVKEVRAYLYSVDGFKEIHIIERTENWGLARNIIDGVTRIVNQYGKIIVLEDDIVTSRYFLKYMNDALEVYKNHNNVMNICGHCWAPDKDKNELPETFFLPWNSCWGWGTWDNRWSFFKRNPKELVEETPAVDIKRFNFNGAYDIWSQVIDNYNQRIYTWAIFWDVVIFLKKGLVLYCNYDLCQNIGMDGSGEHCGKTDMYSKSVLRDEEVDLFVLDLEYNKDAEKIVERFFKKSRRKVILQQIKTIFRDEGIKGIFKRILNH